MAASSSKILQIARKRDRTADPKKHRKTEQSEQFPLIYISLSVGFHENLSIPGLNPIGSMYAIYGNIYHQYTPNVSIYTIHGSYGSVNYSSLNLTDRSQVAVVVVSVERGAELQTQEAPMASNSFGDGWWLYGFTSATTIPRHHVMVCISLLFACKQLQCRRMGLGLLVNDCCTYLISSSIFAVVGEAPSMNAYASAKCQNLLPAYHIGRCLDEKCLGVEHCIFNLQACLGGLTFNEQFLEDSASILVHFAWYSIQFQSLFEVPKKRFEAFNFQYCSAFFFSNFGL